MLVIRNAVERQTKAHRNKHRWYCCHAHGINIKWTQWKRSELNRTIIKSTTKQRWSSRRLEVTRLPASQQLFHTDAETNSPKFTRKNLTISFTRENTLFGQKAPWQG